MFTSFVRAAANRVGVCAKAELNAHAATAHRINNLIFIAMSQKKLCGFPSEPAHVELQRGSSCLDLMQVQVQCSSETGPVIDIRLIEVAHHLQNDVGVGDL
jgi:hypothetical protein